LSTFSIFGSLSNHYTGTTITFSELIQKIKTPNIDVDEARAYGKGNLLYDNIKEDKLPCFRGNCYNDDHDRNNKKYRHCTGYIYVDIDGFASISEAKDCRQWLSTYSFVAASWLSLSAHGIGALVRVKSCNQYLFPQYWDRLNQIFSGKLCPQTRDYFRLCVVSSDPEVYVNEDADYFDEIHRFVPPSLDYRTYLNDDEFENINTPVIYPDGRDVLRINLLRHKPYFKDGVLVTSNKIRIGKRNKTLGFFSMLLIHLNPNAFQKQILNALLSINKNYCAVPLSDKEVINIFESNYKKFQAGELDVSKYYEKQYIFFHRNCTLPRSEKTRIVRLETQRRLGIGKEAMQILINDAIEVLQDGQRIDQRRVAEFIGKSLRTVAEYWESFKSLVKEYNSTLKSKTKKDASTTLYSLGENNRSNTCIFLNPDKKLAEMSSLCEAQHPEAQTCMEPSQKLAVMDSSTTAVPEFSDPSITATREHPMSDLFKAMIDEEKRRSASRWKINT
jgi:hypothetical protein